MAVTRSMKMRTSPESQSSPVVKTRSQKKAYGDIMIQKIVDFYNTNDRLPINCSDNYEDSLADFLTEFNGQDHFYFSDGHKRLLLTLYPWLDLSNTINEEEPSMETTDVQQCDPNCCVTTLVVKPETSAIAQHVTFILSIWTLMLIYMWSLCYLSYSGVSNVCL